MALVLKKKEISELVNKVLAYDLPLFDKVNLLLEEMCEAKDASGDAVWDNYADITYAVMLMLFGSEKAELIVDGGEP